MTKYYTNIFILSFFLAWVGFLQNAQAQKVLEIETRSLRIKDATQKLQLKLLLNNEQLTKIDTILLGSLPESISTENLEETIESINSKIETVLTKRQKTKFDILKSKWLDELFDTAE